MRPLNSHFPLSACALATALLVSACGGGDATPPPTVVGTSGFAVDGYISAATVVCDTNNNGASDIGEATTTTDSTGFFKFAAPCAAGLVLTGGTNTDTQLPFVGKLKAPAGATMVTPLTTLLAEGMTTDQINTALGLPAGTNVATLDPARQIGGELQNPDLFRKTLVVQQVLQKTAETLAALAGSSDVTSLYSQAAAAMVEVMRSDATALVAGGAVNETVVAAVVKAAATRAQATVNADSLAQVVAQALSTQAKQILDADSALEIQAATLAQQGSNAIRSFAVTHKTALQAAPTEATTLLKNQLTASIGGGTVEPPPPATGTLLVSFDEANPVFTGMGAYGGALPTVEAGPAGGSGSALKIVKPAGQEAWGGTYFGVPAIAFTATRKVITAQVYSTRANAVIKFKVEVAGGVSTEVASAPVPANTWTTASWDMTGIDLSKSYTVIAVTPDQDVTATGQSYYVDTITLAAAQTEEPGPANDCSTSTQQCVGFSEAAAGANPFEGLVSAEVTADPSAPTNKVLKMVKGPSSQPWAGATVFTATAVDGEKTIRTVPTIGLSTNKLVTLRAYSGAAVGSKISLKLENALDPTVFAIAEAITTQQNAWETLTFNFANTTAGAFSTNATYNMASLFPAWSEKGAASPALTANTTFYFDALTYDMAGSTPPPPAACGTTEPTCAPSTVLPGDAIAVYSEAAAAANLDAYPNWGQTTQYTEATLAGNKSLKYSNLNYQGLQFASVNVAAKGKLHLDFWTPDMTEVKVSLISPGKENPVTQTLTQRGWNSVDIDLSKFTAPNLAEVFQIKLEATTAGGTLYVDNIYFWGTGTGTGTGGSGGSGSTGSGDSTAAMGSGGPQTLPLATGNDPHGLYATNDGLLAADYIGKLDANNLRAAWDNASTNGLAKNGNVGFYEGPELTGGSSQVVERNGWVAGNTDNAQGVPNIFRYVLLKKPEATFANTYMGLYVNAPNNGTVDVSTYGNIKFKLWGPAEMYQNANLNPTVQIILAGPKVAGCTATGSGGTEITKNLVANQKIGAGSSYTISLAGWTVNGLCGADTNVTAVNAVLSKLARMVVNIPGSSFNFTNTATGDASLYPTGVNLGPIAFTK